MKINIITVGKAHDASVRHAIAEYEDRLTKFIKTPMWNIIPSSDIERESRAILNYSIGTIILLDETGTLLTTPQLASKIDGYQNTSIKQLTFIIGGAYGVSEAVRQRANFVWSLSPLVFPHQLVRLLLIEQLYRTYDVLAGGKYHHA